MQTLTKKLPDRPGVYIFRGPKRLPATANRSKGAVRRWQAGEVFYIGKATSLKSRVASYFRNDLIVTRGPILVGMVESAKSVDFIETDSVLEALILEAALIKKYQPQYNTKEKDNKSFNYVVVTKEDFPRVITMRGRELDADTAKIKYSFGPFPQGSVLREALNIVRKIFPFRDECSPAYLFNQNSKAGDKSLQKRLAGKPNSGKPCFNAQIGLCPGVCSGTISKTEYAKTIRRIKLFFEGKKKTLVSGLERDMKVAAKNLKFEEAGRIKRMIFALNHIQDVALIKADFSTKSRTSGFLGPGLSGENFRIEAYDVAHISGTNVVGVMVVVEDNEPKKSDYRKFKIKTSTNDDNASLREILERRFNHPEWPMPKLIVVDGGTAQVNTAEKALKEWGIGIPVVGVVKDEHHKPRGIITTTKSRTSGSLSPGLSGSDTDRLILLANSEAHRFAIGFHRQLRGKLR